MSRKYVWVVMGLVILLLPSLQAEELIARGDGRYISSRSELVADAGENIKVQIQSASGLTGKIEIMAEKVNKAGFEFRKLIKADDKTTAEEYSGLINVVLESQAGVLRLLLKAPNPEPWSEIDNAVVIEGKLIVPLGSRLDIDCRYYDFTIFGPMDEVSTQPSFGRYQLNDISGKIDLTTIGSNISARNIRGDISIKGENAEIRINELATVSLARIMNKGGDIIMNDVSGNIEVQNDYGGIKIDYAAPDGGQLQIAGEFCPIDLGLGVLNRAEITINNKNDNVRITLPDTSSAVMNLTVGIDSEIHVTKIPVRPGRIRSEFMELTAGDGTSIISADINGVGDILVTGAK